MVAAFELFGIGVRHTFDSFFTLIFSLLLHSLVLKDFVFLSLHPFNVHDLLSLEFVFIAALPVSFALFVLLLVEGIELLITGLNRLLYLISLSKGLIFLSICLFHFLSDCLDLPIQFLFLTFKSLDCIPNLVLLCLELLYLWFDLRVAFSLGN